jgi:hypothetical protein
VANLEGRNQGAHVWDGAEKKGAELAGKKWSELHAHE